VPFSFAKDLIGRPQPVIAMIGGFDYPGEVVVADTWQSEFGEQLSGVTMFRLVLLQSQLSPSPREISDTRIIVAVQASDPTKLNRIGESRSNYIIESQSAETEQNTETEIRSIREVRASYAAVPDPLSTD
jgi:hypothetical protein